MATITPSKLKIKKNGASDEYLYSFENMTGATSSNAGKKGMVPAPAAGDNEKYLKGDGTWGSPVGDISGKADKVSSATNGNFAALDANGNLTDSGHKHGDYLTEHQDISGKVSGPSNATENNVAIFDGTTGKIIKDSGKTIGKSVPADAVFTDTTYSVATTTVDGLMSSADKTKLNGIATGANKVTKTSELTNDSGFLTSHQDISGKADKVSSATNGNFAALDSNGNLTDSGHKHSDYLISHQDISGKADKDTDAVTGNFASFDASGNPVDSSHKHSDYITSHQDISGKADKVTSATNGNFAALDANGNLTDSGHKHSDYITSHQDISGKADLASPAFTGTPTAPTASAGTNNTQIATTAYVMNAFQANDAMLFKGTIGTGGTVTSLPATHHKGWTYKVITKGTYAGESCEIGDMIICVTDGTVASDSDWTVVQSNIDGAVVGPDSSTADHVASFSGTTGKVIKDSGFTIAKSVPSDAKFTDTTYSTATTSSDGLMSSTDKAKLNGIAEGATANTGTITGITMNGASKGTSGVVNLGTVITAHTPMTDIANMMYPVGAIYTSVISTSPATLFGIGTWEQIKGRFLYACEDSGITAGSTGGAKSVSYTPAGSNSGGSVSSHTLTSDQIPSHSHGLNSHTHSVGAHSHGLNSHKHSVGAHSHGLNSHTHGMNDHVHSVGAHSHGLNSHTHSVSITTSENGSHAHPTKGYYTITSVSSGNLVQSRNYIEGDPTIAADSSSILSAGAHTHTVSGNTGAASGSTANSSAFNTGKATGNTAAASGSTANSSAFDSGAASGSTANSSAFDSGAATGNTGSTGGGKGHSHGFTNPTFSGTSATIATMPPYLAVYMWKRTA